MRTPPLPLSAMVAAAEAEIAKILGACAGPPAFGEVATVAEIVLKGPPAIAAAWRPILAHHGCTFTVSSVFCHSSPQVAFTHPHSPVELADLLLVFDYHHGGVSARQATLVQAKMSKHGAVALGSGKPLAQLHLLRTWPRFTFLSKAYDRRPRNFSHEVAWPDTIACGRYGCIELAAAPPVWGQLDPLTPVPFSSPYGTSLGRFLADLADGTHHAGAPATWYAAAPPATAPIWSFTVAELLDVTARQTHAAMARARGAAAGAGAGGGTGGPGGSGGGRGVSALTRLVHNAPPMIWSVWGDGPPPDLPRIEERRDEAGISFIHGVIERAG